MVDRSLRYGRRNGGRIRRTDQRRNRQYATPDSLNALRDIDRYRCAVDQSQHWFVGLANAWNDRALHRTGNRRFHGNEPERTNERINAGESRNSGKAKLKDDANINDEAGEKANEQDNDHFNDQNNNVDRTVNITVITANRTVIAEQAAEVAGEGKVIE